MADISVTQGSMAAVQVRTPQSATPDIMADAGSKTSQGKEKVSVQTEQELENLVSVSPDGDTVQVSREGSARLQENKPDREAAKDSEKAAVSVEPRMVTGKTAVSEHEAAVNGTVVSEERSPVNETVVLQGRSAKGETTAAEEQAVLDEAAKAVGVVNMGIPIGRVPETERVDEEENVQLAVTSGVSLGEKNVIMVSLEREPEADQTEDKEPYVPEIKSFAGYSDTQLEQMYLKGEISKFDYDQEMDSREEERKVQQEKEMDFSAGMTEQVQKEEQVEQNAVSIQKAFSPEASNTIAPTDRVNIIATLQNLGAV